ncbi:MAG TPA: helix-turn-helix domain-containing protein [Candidatus Saccharimonadales bacterium]|nr:helix-turn-helix domain-containing protein [Candidatus Saccharimonadales bacterium]
MKTASATTDTVPCTEDKVSICLSVLGNKWTGLILTKLQEGPTRFTEIERSLDGISPRTLSQRLDDLVQHEVISKASFAEVPPRVEYTLTQKGQDFIPILNQMATWGEKYPKA